MPPFKDEHILIIAPGSQTTLAQLGLPESFTPASTRLRTRMFPAEDGKWEPYKVRPVRKPAAAAPPVATNGTDVEMGGTDAPPKAEVNDDDEPEYEEDLESDEGAVYPLTEGRITNMPAFLALLNHVHNILSPTLHTPILLIAQPAWTAQDLETLTQFFFEKFKTPAFCIMDSALAVSYAYGVANATVIDVGYQKVDVTAVSDFAVQHVGRTMALTESGGDAMTRRLYELLGPKGWTMDMCEQLKRSPFCEILPHGTPLPGGDGEKSAPVANPAAASAANAPTAGVGAGPTVKVTEAPAAGGDAHIDEEDLDIADKAVDDEGVLDVASIVASGKTQEFLAAQEKKKAAAASRKAAKDARDAADAAAARPLRLPNSKREKVVFHYTERREVVEEPEAEKNPAHEETLQPKDEQTKEKTPEPAAAPTEIAVPAEPVEHGSAPEDAPATTSEPAATTAPTTNGDTAATIDPVAASAPTAVQDTKSTSLLAMDLSQAPDDSVTAAKKEQAKAAKREERRKAREHEGQAGIARKEIEVGTERFLVTSGGVLDAIADAVHRTVLAVDIGKRGDLWDSLVIVGNGSKVRGFKDALLATLTNKYLISPSSATIFTSELPSNLSTPMGTGAQTPSTHYPPGQHPLPTGSAVNPLLLAATTASLPASMQPGHSLTSQFGGGPGSVTGGGASGGHSHSHSSHSQSPTSIKVAKVPEYFPEFKNEGFDECVFLGAQVAAKVLFVQDQGMSGGFMSRVQYNETGPQGVHDVGLAF